MLHVLLIEPHTSDAHFLQDVSPSSMVFTHVTTLAEARDQLNFTTFHVIVSVYGYPDGDVLTLLNHETPVIVLMDGQHVESIIKAFRHGAADVILKEGDYSALLRRTIVETALSHFRQDTADNLSFDQNLVARFSLTNDLRPLSCNAAAAHMLGYGSVKQAMAQPSWAFHFNAESIRFLQNKLRVQVVVQQHSDLLRTHSGQYISVVGNVAIHGTITDSYTLEFACIDITDHTSIEELTVINQDLESRVQQRTRALEESKDRVQLILDKARDAIILTDSQGCIMQGNARFVHMFGMQENTYFNKPITTLFAPENKPDIEAMLAEAPTVIEGFLEMQAVTPEGRPFYVEVSVALMPRGGYLFSVHNIDDRIRAEQLLRQSEADLRTVFDSASIGLILFDNEMSIRTANTIAVQVVQDLWSVDPLHPNMEEHIEPHLFEEFTQAFQSALDGCTVNRQMSTLDRFGQQMHLALTYTPVIDEKSRVTGVCVVTENITARKQAEEALRKSEERYRFITDLISDYAYSVVRGEDGSLALEWITTASFERISGYNIDEHTSIEAVLALISHEDDRQRAKADLERAFEGQPVSGEYRLIQRDGTVRWVHITRQPVWDDERQTYTRAVGAVRDITEQLEMEHALREALRKANELNEMKSRFVSMVSHEFRTPLATIQAAAELLQTHADRMTHEQRERRFNKIRQQIEHMTLMLEDVLTIGRFEAGTVEFRPVEVELTGFIHELVDEHQQTYGTHHITVEGFEQPVHITGDLKLLRQTFTNLISNARKYSEAGTTISLTLECHPDTISLSVSDEGIGIPSDDLPQLFHAFRRAGNVGTIQGNGLGLSIIKQAMELHDGDIHVESVEGQGTTFTVELPLKQTVLVMQ